MRRSEIILSIILILCLVFIFVNGEKILNFLKTFSFYEETLPGYNISQEIPEYEKPEMNASELEAMIHNLTNLERAKYNLSFFDWNNEVAEVARSHSQFMAETGIFSHTNLQGQNVSDRLR